MSFPVWINLDRLNAQQKKPPVYILLLLKTDKFNLECDIKQTLGIKNKPFQWFLDKFIRYRVHCFYYTLFTSSQRESLGPITKHVSDKICSRLLNQKLSSTTTLVGPTYLLNQFNHSQKQSAEDFSQFLLRNKR